MVWNRSRAVRTKQALMSDQTPLFLSPTKNPNSSPISSFFNGFLFPKSNLESETTSPTSILDPKIPNYQNPFALDPPPPPPPMPPRHHDFEKSIGLALIDSIADDLGGDDCRFPKPINRLALKVQIPEISSSISAAASEQSPRSPADFGIKTRGLQVTSPSPFGGGGGKGFVRQLSLKEMEMSEDYTCVIKHGPNPETKHIYDDCILDNHDPKLDLSQPQIEESKDFFGFCHAYKAALQEDKEIYIYSGEKAFCSQECRSKEMVMENPGAF
ncbi:FCS-Like Zinc finger 8-like isoform X1 [Salvia splendens]|uniref:FCS-Like Zinc finger 8-like isoform X1 n=1 Tax=Salvia splendens TaxID=180675 RepID=UPI0011036BA7|nr:FCS-Like Zinc finger 8-like isoform X1 [Salvia splendens]